MDRTGAPVRLGKYHIVACLGQGGMSKVYLAVSRGAVDDVRKLVVLKVLHEHLVGNEEYVGMFLREAKIAVDLSHPNVVHTYTVGQEDDRYCIVMEYINGIPLSKVLVKARAEAWSFEKRLPLLGALCLMLSGLNYVHDFRDLEGNLLRLVHRDLKPSNVLLGFDGQVKLLDFGVVKMTAPEHDQTERLSLKGTVQYLAPEALQGARQIDRRYDVFAAGLILWEIVTGRRMWANRQPLEVMRGLADDEMAKFIDEEPDIPEELRPVLLKALAADRDVRYPTALDLKSAIQSFLLAQGVRIDPEQLARIVNDGFGSVRDQRQAVVSKRLRDLREGVEVGAPEELLAGPDSLSSGIASASATDLGAPASSLTSLSAMKRSETDNAPPPPQGQQRGRGAMWAALLAVPLLGVGAYVALSNDESAATEPAPAPTASREEPKDASGSKTPEEPAATPEPSESESPIKVTLVVNPSTASVEIDGEVHSDTPIVLEGTDPTQSHQIVARADGYATETIDLELTRSRTLDIELQPLSAAATDEPATRRRRGRRASKAPEPEPRPAAPVVEEPAKPAKPAPARPASPRPGDDINVKRGKKRGADAPNIDSEIPWK